MSESEIKWPQEYISSNIEIVRLKDGKTYEKTGHYKFLHYSYKEIKHEKIELPQKLPDIPRNENK